jgi:hypothetical protein
MCYLGYDDVLPCDLFVFDVPTGVCYMGNRATNKNMTVPNEVSHVYFNPGNALINKKESVQLLNIYFGHTVFSDIIDPVVDPIYLDQGSVSGSTWAPYIFNTVDLSELAPILQMPSCKAACHFSVFIQGRTRHTHWKANF